MVYEWPRKSEEDMKKIITAHKAGDIKTVDLGEGIFIEMVFIPAGEFVMGSPENELGRHLDEAQHKVIITKPFYIGKYPITQEQWLKIMGYNYSGNKKGGKYPIEFVDWDECRKFIFSLNKFKIDAGRFRLPTEAEWEYAYRAGTTTAYYWGNEVNDDYCWYRKIKNLNLMRSYYIGNSHKVGMKKPNAWGLYDMAGNVFELCSDWILNWKDAPTEFILKDPKGAKVKNIPRLRKLDWHSLDEIRSTKDEVCIILYEKVCKGGCWNWPADCCRAAYKGHNTPDSSREILGFRVVLTINNF